MVRIGTAAPTAKVRRRCQRGLQRPGRKLLGQSQLVARVRAERVLRHEPACDRPRKLRLQAAPHIDPRELVLLGLRLGGELALLACDIRLLGVGLRADRHVFAGGHRQRARDEASDAGDQDLLRVRLGRGNADDQARRRDDAVVSAKHRRAQPADSCTPVLLTMSHEDLKRSLAEQKDECASNRHEHQGERAAGDEPESTAAEQQCKRQLHPCVTEHADRDSGRGHAG